MWKLLHGSASCYRGVTPASSVSVANWVNSVFGTIRLLLLAAGVIGHYHPLLFRMVGVLRV